MQPVALTPTEQFDKVQILMDVVDTVRHAQMDNDRLLAEFDSDDQMVEHIKAIYQSQGMPVDEGTIREGLRLMKERRFEFQPPRESVALKAARLYVSRSEWGPRFLFRTGAVTTAAVITLAVSMAVSMVRENAWMDRASQSAQDEIVLRQDHSRALATVAKLPLNPAPVAQGARTARTALDEAERGLVALPAIPNDPKSQEALYERDKPAARKLVAARTAQLEAARTQVGTAQNALQGVASFQVALRGASAFDQAVPVYLESLRDTLKLQFETAASTGDTQRMGAAVASLETTLAVDGQRVALEGQAQSVGSTAAPIIASLAEAQTLLVAGNLSGAQSLVDDAGSKLAMLPMSYTLRIVSEEGERSVVWRYYDNNRSARSYYVLVDAIDASGNRVELPITSAEDKNTRTASRFGVRIPESVYEAIAADKTADGIVDNDMFGRKVAGELEVRYEFETAGGMITNW